MIELDNTISVVKIGPRTSQGQFSPGPVRFREDGGAWRRINTDLALSGGVYVPVDTPFGLEIAPDGGRRIYPDRQDLSKYVDFSAPSWLAGLTRQVGRNFIKVFGSTWTLTLSVGKLGVKLDVLFAALPSFTKATFPISVTGYNVAQLLSSGRIQKPILIDAVGTERDLEWSYQAGQLRVNLDFTGLVFPVVLDPAFSVAESLDDCRALQDGSTFNQTGTFLMTGVNAGATLTDSAMRFLPTIPSGSTIDSCFLTMYAAFSGSGTTVNSDFFFETDNAATQIADYADFYARTLGDPLAWDSVGAWTAGSPYDSPSLVSILQPRATAGNITALNLFWKDGGSSTNAFRYPASFENTSYTEPVLTITWTEAGGGATQAAYYYRLYGSGVNRG